MISGAADGASAGGRGGRDEGLAAAARRRRRRRRGGARKGGLQRARLGLAVKMVRGGRVGPCLSACTTSALPRQDEAPQTVHRQGGAEGRMMAGKDGIRWWQDGGSR